MSETTTYPFDGDFQAKILALIIRDKRFLRAHRRVVHPGFFDNPTFSVLCRKVFTYFDKYRATPGKVVVLELVQHSKDGEDLSLLIDFLYEIDLDDASYVRDRTLQFARQQAVRRALKVSGELLTSSDFTEIKSQMDKALLVGTAHEDLGSSFFEGIPHLCEYLSADASNERRIPTLLAELDDVLGGGTSPGEFNIIMAPPNEGKSIWLVNMAFAALWQKKNVLFVSLEMEQELIEARLASRMTGIPVNSLPNHLDDLTLKMAEISPRSGKLVTKFYPNSTASVEDIRGLIVSLQQSEGFVPDLLVVDYLDILRAPYMKEVNPYIAQGEIGKALKGLAGEFNMHLWTATQANRGSVGKDALSMTDKAESWRVIADADVVLGLTRSREDLAHNTAIVSLAKIRNGDKSKFAIHLTADYKVMFFGDLT